MNITNRPFQESSCTNNVSKKALRGLSIDTVSITSQRGSAEVGEIPNLSSPVVGIVSEELLVSLSPKMSTDLI